ncbi:Hsp70 family protein [Reinekea sp.]|jgi:hypothetical chaperone protein|uniref:Hsp70 family protein n=1 Tax=Reinekea sp. TaxID=1970455 RepID=UPI002A7EA8B2|nr:Hsp70 family protein [Reinekea sp.]
MSLCGLDFGTSNSTVGVVVDQRATMVPLEQHPRTGALETTLPSALFFDFEGDNISFGRHAIEDYTRGDFGRLMRSMKSILGSRQMDDGTRIKNKLYSFNDIIGFFIQSLKQRAEQFSDQALESVVLGRPVHFNDHHPDLDAAAEARLSEIARAVGFKNISFQFEPIAAAYDYEQTVDQEEIALIIDIGGGTSDFTLIKLSKANREKTDRQADLLANHGIHIGGTDFDRHLSLATVMPHFGLGVPYKDKPNLAMPIHYYVDLGTWHRIHSLYDPKVLRDLADLRLNMAQPDAIARLIRLLKQKDGHRLAGQVEQAKIDLADRQETDIDLSFLNRDSGSGDTLAHPVNRARLDAAIQTDVDRVFAAVAETLAQAGIGKAAINTIFTTGGSTALPSVRALIQSQFPDANWVSGDLFNSVGKGLVLEAQRRY